MLPDREYARPTDISKALHERARQSMAGADYPADLDDLIRYASNAGADAAITDTLRQLPDGQYDSVDAVIIAIIEIEEE
jgi:hypothetical protein